MRRILGLSDSKLLVAAVAVLSLHSHTPGTPPPPAPPTVCSDRVVILAAEPLLQIDDGCRAISNDARVIAGAHDTFRVAASVIAAVERWAGHRIDWGHDGRLTLEPFAAVGGAVAAHYDRDIRTVQLGVLGRACGRRLCAFDAVPDGWQRSARGLLLIGASMPDVVAHEAAHAVVHTLKPGWKVGVAHAIDEGLADVVAFLIALEDDQLVAAALHETNGDLRRPNEIARMYEELGHAVHRFGDADRGNDNQRYVRLLTEEVTLGAARIDATDKALRGTLARRGTGSDPHFVGQIVSGALYEAFTALYAEAAAAGEEQMSAVRGARENIGRLVMRSFWYLPENEPSLGDFGRATLRAAADVLPRHSHLLEPVLARRGLAGTPLANGGTAAAPRSPGAGGRLVAAAPTAAACAGATLLRGLNAMSGRDRINMNDLQLVAVRSAGQLQLVQARYEVALLREHLGEEPARPVPGWTCHDELCTRDAYVSAVFDHQGRPVWVNHDLPPLP